MKTIFRYNLNSSINDVELPSGAEVISVGVSKNERTNKEIISMWVSVNTTTKTFDKRRFLVFGTGANMDDTSNFNMKYLGTVIKSNMYAFHIFEVKDSIY